jgi:hypothetical protein
MWMAWDWYHKTGHQDQVKVNFFTGMSTMFSVKKSSGGSDALHVERGVGGHLGGGVYLLIFYKLVLWLTIAHSRLTECDIGGCQGCSTDRLLCSQRHTL